MRAVPDHVAVGFVAEHRDLPAADQLGERLQIVPCGHTAGRVVGRIEKDRSRRGIFGEKALDVLHCGAEPVGLLQRRKHGPGRAPLDIGHIGGEVGAEDEHAVTGVEKGFAEELLENLRAGSGDDILFACGNVELAAHELCGGGAKFREARRRAVMRLIGIDGRDAAGARRRRAVERTVADLEFDDVLSRTFQSLGDAKHGERGLDGQGSGKIAESHRLSALQAQISMRAGLTVRNRAAVAARAGRGVRWWRHRPRR